jgi:Spy/CpxP family protein refolding chaperone
MRKIVLLFVLGLVLAAGTAAVLTAQPASAGPPDSSEGPGGCGSRCR